MEPNELLFQVRRLRRYVSEVAELQRKCRHAHHCHWNEKLDKAETLAYEIEREIEIQQGEQLAKAVTG